MGEPIVDISSKDIGIKDNIPLNNPWAEAENSWKLLNKNNITKAEIMVGNNFESFDRRIDSLMEKRTRIIAFRGAGSTNGIDPAQFERVTQRILDGLSYYFRDDEPIAFIYDGDPDDRDNPDIGAIFGVLADYYKDNKKISVIAVQKKSWYYPEVDGGVLKSATGIPYETFVFDDIDDGMSGGHSAFSQSEKLVNYHSYEQLIVGPSGKIVLGQLTDLNSKVREGTKPVDVMVFKAHNNPNLDSVNNEALAQAELIGDTTKISKISEKIKQRTENPFGELHSKDGRLTIDRTQYPNINFRVVQV